MVKLIQPLMSSAAAGALADVLDFARHPSGGVAAKHRRPRQPRTLSQRATRTWMTWLSKEWARLSAGEKESWDQAPNADTTSPYHAYLQFNTNRFKFMPDDWRYQTNNSLWPSAAYPPTKATLSGILQNNTGTGGPGTITHRYLPAALKDGWFQCYHLQVPGITYGTYANLVHIENTRPGGWQEVIIRNLPPGLQTLGIITASRTALPMNGVYQITATVT